MSDISLHSNDLVQFASLLLHDLETPLAVVKQFLNRVQDGRHDPNNPRHKKLLASTQLAIQRGERILEDLLDQARSGSRELCIHRLPADLRPVVADCLRMITPIAEDRMVQLRSSIDPTVPESLEADAGLIARVIDNLLVNAVRHAARLSAVDIKVHTVDHGVRIEVRNRAEKDFDVELEHIFDPTYQIQMREQRRMRGSGLGLTFSRQVVLAHGGAIGAYWDDGSQVVFWFEIPAKG